MLVFRFVFANGIACCLLAPTRPFAQPYSTRTLSDREEEDEPQRQRDREKERRENKRGEEQRRDRTRLACLLPLFSLLFLSSLCLGGSQFFLSHRNRPRRARQAAGVIAGGRSKTSKTEPAARSMVNSTLAAPFSSTIAKGVRLWLCWFVLRCAFRGEGLAIRRRWVRRTRPPKREATPAERCRRCPASRSSCCTPPTRPRKARGSP